ncbi:MAG: VWA domain-containing protein [Candidatus Absconditabacterales bacterium]|nr:VWA domain-containing protein [Candidatus Absconditabacterales bacterium]
MQWSRFFLAIKWGGAIVVAVMFIWMGRTHYHKVRPDRIHLVMSQSLTMLGLDGEDGQTRLDDARHHIETILAAYPHAQVSLSFLAGEIVHRVPLTMQSGFLLEHARSVNPWHLLQSRQEGRCSLPDHWDDELIVVVTDGWDRCGYAMFEEMDAVVIPVGGLSRPAIQRPDGSSATQGLPRNDRALASLPWKTPQTLGGMSSHVMDVSRWWLFVLLVVLIV